MGRALTICLGMALAVSACKDDVVVVGDVPAAPRALSVTYYAGSVTVSWELAPDWNGEAFRIYSRRATDSDWFFIAEVTSCIDGFCSYEDLNVLPNETYQYYVSAVGDGVETSTDVVSVFVPPFTPPPIPNAPYVIALDRANYVTWGTASRDGAADFSYYNVYFDDGSDVFLIGDTDSEGFLDQRVENGSTYSYFVTAVDTDGHESDGSELASGTPRPDYHNEWIWDYLSVPDSSGFRFTEDETIVPIMSGDDALRQFRLESDGVRWWMVPNGVEADVNNTAWITTALKCGPEADSDCTDVSTAPTTGYDLTHAAVELFPQTTYVLRVTGDDGLTHYGAVRVQFLGFDQTAPIMIFEWAYQLQPDNPSLVSPVGS